MKTKQLRKLAFNRYGGRCGYCGILLIKFQIDHIIPKRNFIQDVTNNNHIPKFLCHLTVNDLNHIDNLMAVCQSCNNYKGACSLEVFREMIQDIPRKLKYQSIYTIGQRYGYTVNEDLKVKFYFEKFEEEQA